jgi:hypothetical protein
MSDPREPYGRLFHEQGRIPVNAEREKPFAVGPWERRTREQQEIDMRGASAVAAQAVADAKLDVAALEMARRKLGRIAALARNAVESTPRGGTPGVNADLLLALIGNEEGGDRA